MKTLFFFLIVICLANTSYGQTRADSAAMYLEKSQQQKKTAWILLGASAGAMAASIPLVNEGSDIVFGGLLAMAGAGLAVTSGGFFVASASNSEKAANLSLQLENPPIVLENGQNMTYPSIALRIRLGRR